MNIERVQSGIAPCSDIGGMLSDHVDAGGRPVFRRLLLALEGPGSCKSDRFWSVQCEQGEMNCLLPISTMARSHLWRTSRSIWSPYSSISWFSRGKLGAVRHVLDRA